MWFNLPVLFVYYVVANIKWFDVVADYENYKDCWYTMRLCSFVEWDVVFSGGSQGLGYNKKCKLIWYDECKLKNAYVDLTNLFQPFKPIK